MAKRVLAGLLLTLAMGIGSLTLSGVAHAQDTTTCATYGCGPTSPSGTADAPTAADAPATGTQAATDGPYTSSSSLAFTGTDVIGTVILGLALVGGGLVIVRVSRRRRAQA